MWRQTSRESRTPWDVLEVVTSDHSKTKVTRVPRQNHSKSSPSVLRKPVFQPDQWRCRYDLCTFNVDSTTTNSCASSATESGVSQTDREALKQEPRGLDGTVGRAQFGCNAAQLLGFAIPLRLHPPGEHRKEMRIASPRVPSARQHLATRFCNCFWLAGRRVSKQQPRDLHIEFSSSLSPNARAECSGGPPA